MAEHHDQNHDGLSILTYVSTLLTIGNKCAPTAHNVHAVTGVFQQEEIRCLVIAENTPSNESAINVLGTPRLKQKAQIASNAGGKLLEQWDHAMQ